MLRLAEQVGRRRRNRGRLAGGIFGRPPRSVHSAGVSGTPRFFGCLAALTLFACAGSKPSQPLVSAPKPAPVVLQPAAPPLPEAEPQAAQNAMERWYFEWLSKDGKRVLLRRLDVGGKSFHARVVEVDSGKTVDETELDALAKIPFSANRRDANDLVTLENLLRSPAFEADLVRSAKLVGAFPSCGRVSAAPDGSAIAFNAGDWLYVADKSGHVRKALSPDAAYDPRFSPDGRHILFRKFGGRPEGGASRYELYVVPSDLSGPSRRIEGTAGVRDPIVVNPDAQSAIAVVSREPAIKTCVLSVGLKAPFSVKKLGCVDGGEQLVEAVLSPKGRWAALTTRRESQLRPSWRLRVLSLSNGKVALDADAEPGLTVRAISDDGLLVQSGLLGVVVDDVPAKKRRSLTKSVDIGYRTFFRKPTELVFVQGRDVGVVDLAKD